MKLLVFTQAIDRNDPVLSAYHRLVKEIALNFEAVTVVCLKKGEYDLPPNVKVLSLGKEEGLSRFGYVFRFYRYIFTETYDAVFVHMNQEYVLLGGKFWRLMGKKVYMWRNHHEGSFLTDIAAFFCAKVFCTSKFSYTAKYKKTVIMPVGIDTDFFRKVEGAAKTPRSMLFLARIAPVKKPHVLIEALEKLSARGVGYKASFVGDPLEKNNEYHESLKEKSARSGINVEWKAGIPNEATPRAYSEHEIFVNLSSSGMYDKTIFEAMACEAVVLATNRNLEGLIDEKFIAREDDAEDIARRLEALLNLSAGEKAEEGKKLRQVAQNHHSLRALGQKLAKEIS
jgi:glycosyltransferase involved in cell wall biosynthesis